MHELKIAQSILRVAVATAATQEPTASRISRIRLKISQMSHLTPESLRFCFEHCSGGTIAEGAFLEIETVPISLKCQSCGQVSPAKDYQMICPSCGSEEVEVVQDKEFEIEAVEVE